MSKEKELKDLSWDELLEATSFEQLRYEHITNISKIGGKIAGNITYENKTGIHSPEHQKKYYKEWIETKKGMFDLDFQREKGLRHAKEGKGIHGLSEKEKLKNAKKGAAASAKKLSKKVLQYDLDGNFIAEHESLMSASRSVGKNNSGSISACCSGNQKKAYGFIWKYKENN